MRFLTSFTRGRALWPILVLTLILLTNTICTPILGQETYATYAVELTVYQDGVTRVVHILLVNELSLAISVPLLATSIENVLALDEEGLPLDYTIVDSNISIDALGAAEVTLQYDTAALTRKEGIIWTLSLNTTYSVKIQLPEESTVIYINRIPSAIDSKDNSTVLSLSAGEWEISYIPPVAAPPATPPTSTPTPTILPTILTSPYNYFIGLLGVVAIAAGALLLKKRFAAKTRVSLKEGVELKLEDKEVLDFIVGKGGRVLEAELRQRFALPKTSMWRLVKRLERMGFVKVRKIGSQNEIELVKTS